MEILQNELADIIGVSPSVLHTYLGHYTLTKYEKLVALKIGNKKHRHATFIISPESLYALQEYLKMKLRYGKSKNKIKLSGIEKLKKLYEEKSLD